MKNLVVLIAGCLLAVSASAQNMNIEQKAHEVARDIQRYGRSLTGSERLEVAQKLESISRILRGDNSDVGGNGNSEYTCVSKDNDGVRPFVIAVRNGIDVQRTNLAFNSMSECNESLSVKRFVGNRTALVCASKDGDGVRPFQMIAIGAGGVQKIERTVTNTLAECRALVESLQIDRRGTALLCVSKDSDGVRPFVAAELDVTSKTVRIGTEQFDSKQACDGFIRR
jgi:hypothetical protein